LKNLAVVILNFNGKLFLEKFLRNTIENSLEAEVVVVDNCSTDDSVSYLQHFFPTTTVITLDKNYGFAEGYNQGLSKLNHEYFVLLNSDVEVTEGWLRPLIKAALNNLNVVAVQPKILDFNRKSHFEYAGAAGGFVDVLGYPFCRGRIFDHLEEDQNQYESSTEIFWGSGACLLIKSEIFHKYNGFDKRFFAHMEEIDLCWRIQNDGYKIVYEPKSVVYHVGGGTLPVESPRKTYLNHRNNLAMMFKNTPLHLVLPLIFFRLCLDGISGVKYLFDGKIPHIWSIVKAHFVFYSWIPYLIKNRSKSFRGFSKLYAGSVVWEYFIKKKKTYPEICLK
jgi:GT2 family glycosyltransferase